MKKGEWEKEKKGKGEKGDETKERKKIKKRVVGSGRIKVREDGEEIEGFEVIIKWNKRNKKEREEGIG